MKLKDEQALDVVEFADSEIEKTDLVLTDSGHERYH